MRLVYSCTLNIRILKRYLISLTVLWTHLISSCITILLHWISDTRRTYPRVYCTTNRCCSPSAGCCASSGWPHSITTAPSSTLLDGQGCQRWRWSCSRLISWFWRSCGSARRSSPEWNRRHSVSKARATALLRSFGPGYINYRIIMSKRW